MTHLIPLSEALGPIRDVYAHLITDAVRWQAGQGDRVLVVMNADAAAASDVTADLGAELPMLRWASAALWTAGGVLLPTAAVTIGRAGRTPPAPSRGSVL